MDSVRRIYRVREDEKLCGRIKSFLDHTQENL